MDGAKLNLNIEKLKDLVKQFEDKKEVRVGVFDDSRSAEIGIKHEFGDPLTKLPMRSFIRMPIYEKGKQLSDSFNDSLERDYNLENAYNVLALEAEDVIEEAFETGGFGKWDTLSDRTTKRKGHDKILIETGQLKDSIKSKVVKL